MLMPKKTKYSKMMKGRNRGYAVRGIKLNFGDYGIKAVEAGRINSNQIEAARIAMTRYVNREAKVWINVFPDKPLTKKPLQTRMGKGKTGVEEWVMNIKPGRIIFELTGVNEDIARRALELSMHKLPFKTKIVTRESENEIY